MRPQQPRAGQNWIFDNFLKISEDENVLHPGMLGIRLERGFKYSDMERVFRRVSGRRAFPREWARIAEEQEDMAATALAAGRRVTASQHYHRAALYYGRAQHLIAQDKNPKKIAFHASEIRCYDRVIEMFDGAITRHSIPFEDGKQVYCLFHHAPGAGRKPTVLYNPGMDATKEDFPNPFNNEFARRGMNIVSMDGPGQGECNINGVWLKLGNYARAGKKVLDFICTLPDVDSDRIGGFGTSMGTRYSVEIASADRRVRAVAGQMPCVGPSDVIFNQAQPNFKRIHMYMMAMKDEAAFDAAIDDMDEKFMSCGSALSVPYLLVAGDMDELCPVEDIDAWMARLRCPKELWLYEDVFHPMGEVAADVYPALADWMWDALHNGRPADHDVRKVIRS